MKKTALLLLFFGGTAFGSNKCPGNDIAKINTKNLQIKAPKETSEPLKFENGIATVKIVEEQEEPEWEYTIKKYDWVTPLRGLRLRVLTINKNHIRGSGSYDLFTVLGCEHEQLKMIWPMTEVNSVTVSEKNIEYETLGKYRGAQARGSGKRFVLEWNPTRRSFVKQTQ